MIISDLPWSMLNRSGVNGVEDILKVKDVLSLSYASTSYITVPKTVVLASTTTLVAVKKEKISVHEYS